MRTQVVVLISGHGSNLLALLEDAHRGGEDSPYQIVGVIADREAPGLSHADRRGIPTTIVRCSDYSNRAAWDCALAEAIASFAPDLVVLAGFMKLLGSSVLDRFPGRIINTHPALLPAFPGAHGVRDALAYGVKVSGASVIEVDAGVDTGRILAQTAVPVLDDDTEDTLHERIKAVEHVMLVEVVRQLAAGLSSGVSGASHDPGCSAPLSGADSRPVSGSASGDESQAASGPEPQAASPISVPVSASVVSPPVSST
ncbi:phosphoribosylglycinamide formyltransferase [Devriesea agamarum]|uniref:phosphoribosylglycinamide formyltransferase n=1 Tax=Devriesea agamarum TaxID=472569 RepID=UPI002F90EAD9